MRAGDLDDDAELCRERDRLAARLREIDQALAGSGHAALRIHGPWQSVLDALPAHVALLDPGGRVTLVNEAWRRFAAENGYVGEQHGVGQNYLQACSGTCAEEGGDDDAAAASRGIRAVLDGEVEQFALEYPCHAPDAQRWFRLMVTPISTRERLGCVVMHLDITERRVAEEALRASEARLRAILDAEPECVKLVGSRGELLSMSPAGLRMIEAEAFEQVAGRQVLELVHPEDRKDFLDLHRRVLAGADGELQFRIVGLRGTPRWMETHSTPMRAPDGSVEAVLSVTRDVTARREAEIHLGSLQRLTQNILDSVGEGIQGVDREGRITFINPAASAMLGCPEAEAVGALSHALFHHHLPDGRPYPPADCPIHRTIADGRQRRVDSEVFFRRDGGAIPVEYVVSPVRGPDGGPEGAVICFRDISPRLADQAALALSEERFRLVARATANAIWDHDLRTGEVVWNEGLESMFGYRSEQVQGGAEFWVNRIHPDDRELVLESLQQCVRGEQDHWEQEYRFRRQDGSFAVVVDRGSVVRDAGGVPVRMLGGMTDVSEMRTLEAQLRASQRLEAVGQLTGGLAHDFNNLLTVVLGNAELLEERLGADAEQRELAHMILVAAERGADLTQRLLAFARKQALEARPTCLGELVRAMERLVRRVIGDDIELVVLDTTDHAQSLVDAGQFENALLNLCINARDAMPSGGRLTIALALVRAAPSDIDPLSRSAVGDYLRLEVRDTGAGIPADILPLVVEPFFTTKEVGKGTGLGLSMVYGLVKQSDGFLDIRSEPGRGTCISIHLPRHAAAAAPAAADPDADDAPGGSERVLLVEDDVLVREFARSQLLSLGYQVTVAGSGREALEVLASDRPFDLLLTDVLMPGGINGRQLADRALQMRPGLRVLFSSGHSVDALAEQGRLPAGVQMLAKPYRKTVLARRVRQALAGEATG